MTSNNRRFYRTNSLIAINESDTGSSLLFSIAEVLESTSESVVAQMFSSPDGITWGRTDERRTISLSKIIVGNITMTQKNTLKQKSKDIIYKHINIYAQ